MTLVCKEKCHNIKTEGQIVVQLLPSSWSIVAWQSFISPESKEGHKYAMVFVDDYSGAFGVHFLNPFTTIFFTKISFFNPEIRFLVVTTLNGP